MEIDIIPPTVPELVIGFKVFRHSRAAISSKDGIYIITGGDDRSICVWDGGRYTDRFTPTHCHRVCSYINYLYIREDLNYIFAGHTNGTIGIYKFDSLTGAIEDEYRYDGAHNRAVTAIRYDEHKRVVLSCSKNGHFAIHEAADDKPPFKFNFNSECTALDNDPVSKIVFIALADGKVKMMHYGEEPIVPLSGSLVQYGRISSILWQASCEHFFIGSNSNNITSFGIIMPHPEAAVFLRLRTSVCLATHWSTIILLGYSPATNELISVGEQGTIAISDMNADRFEPPKKDLAAKRCYRCLRYFRFSLLRLFRNRQRGTTRWHCEHCGKAICRDCGQPMKYPPMGFELDVLMCPACFNMLQAETRPTTLERKFNIRQKKIIASHFHPDNMLLLTLHKNNRVNLWNLLPRPE